MRSPEARIRVDPAVAEAVEAQRAAVEAQLIEWGVPFKLGSFAALVKPEASSTGTSMLLGAPQMGLPSATAKAVTSEVELMVAGGIHIAGMTVPGIPGVIIGRVGSQSDQRSWTLTTGFTDNTDTYAEVLGEGGQKYFYNGSFQPFDVIVDEIQVLGGEPVTYPHFRTVHGPVYTQDPTTGSPSRGSTRSGTASSRWSRRSTARGSLTASPTGSRSPARSRCPSTCSTPIRIRTWPTGTSARTPCAPSTRACPPLASGARSGWALWTSPTIRRRSTSTALPRNWNNKPETSWDQGDNVPWTDTTPSGYTRTFDGAKYLDQHLGESQRDGGGISFEELQGLTRVIRTNPQYPEYPGTYQQVLAYEGAT